MSFSPAFYLTSHWQIAAGILLALLIAGEAGWRVGHGGRIEDDALRALVGGIAAATLALLGLLLERAAQPGLNPAVLSSLIASANEVIDLDELRTSSLENYVPAPIILLLIGVGAVALAFFGWSFGAAERRSTTSMVALAFLLTAVLTVIMDLNRPHRGMIRVEDQSLVRLRRTIAAAPAGR